MQRYHNVVQDKKGQAIVGAQIRVKEYPSGIDAIIYKANSPTSSNRIVNLQTDERGQFQFYAEDGRYNIEVWYSGEMKNELVDVLIEDPVDPNEVNTNRSSQRNADIQSGIIRLPVVIEALFPVWDAINELSASSLDYGLVTEPALSVSDYGTLF